MKRCFALFSVYAGLCQLVAQESPDPIEVAALTATHVDSQTPVRLQLTNRGNKAIAAYVLILDYTNSNGQRVWSNAHMAATSGVVPTVKSKPFAPGQVRNDPIDQHPVPTGTERYKLNVSVDYTAVQNRTGL